MRKQVAPCFANLTDILNKSQTTFEHVVKFTIFTTDIDRFSREARECHEGGQLLRGFLFVDFFAVHESFPVSISAICRIIHHFH
jgi:enamine deaminase RidA (YjgF/YER057c/UK114 family)